MHILKQFDGKHVVRGHVAPVRDEPQRRPLNHLRNRLHSEQLLAEVNSVAHAGRSYLRFKLVAGIAVSVDLKPRAGTRRCGLLKRLHRQIEPETFCNRAVVDDSEFVDNRRGRVFAAKDKRIRHIRQYRQLAGRSPSPYQNIAMRMMNADGLVCQPDAELLLLGKNENQRMLLRESELRHVHLRHHVVDVEDHPRAKHLGDHGHQHKQIGHGVHIDDVVPLLQVQTQQLHRRRTKKSEVAESIFEKAAATVP